MRPSTPAHNLGAGQAAGAEPGARPRTRWLRQLSTWSGWAALSVRQRWLWVCVTATVLATRVYALGRPGRIVFDELWYVPDANVYLGRNRAFTLPGTPAGMARIDETTWIHPPLAKWIIALGGVLPFDGRTPGVRIPSLLAGCAAVLLVGAIVYRVFRSHLWAAFATLLVTFDGMVLVHSRLATLDVFMLAFGLGAVWVALGPLERGGCDGAGRWAWAWALTGASVACKWSGVTFAVVVVAIAVTRRRRGQLRGATLRAVLLVPGVYLASYWSFFAQHGPNFVGFVRLQCEMLMQNRGVTSGPNPMAARPGEWLLSQHIPTYATRFMYSDHGPDWVLRPLTNPVLWWGFLACVPVLAWLAVRRRDPAAACSLVVVACTIVPFLGAARNTYAYYMLPALMLGYPLGIVAVGRRLPGRVQPVVVGLATLVTVGVAATHVTAWYMLPQ